MFPVAGVVLWITIGLLAGVIAAKISGTDDANRMMANLGVGLVSAVLGGAVVAFAAAGNVTNAGFVLSIVASLVISCVALAVFRGIYRGPSSTVR